MSRMKGAMHFDSILYDYGLASEREAAQIESLRHQCMVVQEE